VTVVVASVVSVVLAGLVEHHLVPVVLVVLAVLVAVEEELMVVSLRIGNVLPLTCSLLL
jgi:hypothetical protein